MIDMACYILYDEDEGEFLITGTRDQENVVNNKERHVQLIRIRDDIQAILVNIEKQQEIMNQNPDPLRKLEIIHSIIETYQTSLQFNPDYQEDDKAEEGEGEGHEEGETRYVCMNGWVDGSRVSVVSYRRGRRR